MKKPCDGVGPHCSGSGYFVSRSGMAMVRQSGIGTGVPPCSVATCFGMPWWPK